MSTVNYNKIASFRLFGAFFEGLPAFEKALAGLKPAPATPAAEKFMALAAATPNLASALYSEYEKLFYGTDAEVYVPIWASACKTNGPILLDQTTLDLILFCRGWGFDPPVMDGNPPDFIGSQLAFLEYLEGCRLHARNGGASETEIEKYGKAMADFNQGFVLDTVTAMNAAARKFNQNEVIGVFLDLLAAFVAADFAPPFTVDADALSNDKNQAETFPFGAAALQKGQRPPIETEPEKSIPTSGINNCGGRCVVRCRTRAGCVLDIDTDRTSRDPQLRACIRGRAYRQTFFNATRLRYPMKRIGKRGEGRFTRISWDEAADITAKEWARIRDAYGPASRFFVLATGNEAVLRGDHFCKRLLNMEGGFLGMHNSYSAACVMEISPYIYGDLMGGHSMDDLQNTKLLILWGNNPAETLLGTERNYALTQLKKKGVRVIAIDPRESDSVIAYADEWIGIKPATDSALADAMAWVIRTENLWDKAFMDKYTLGFDAEHMPEGVPGSESYEAYLLGQQDGIPKTPEWGEKITGVPAATITRLAREYATTKPACIYQGYGVQRTGSGEQSIRNIALLCALTGNVGIPGGSTGAFYGTEGHAMTGLPKFKSAYKGHISHFMWFKLIDEGINADPEEIGLRGADKVEAGIKMMFCIACNTLVNQHSNINETTRILQDESKCEFILNADIFMTSSVKYSDMVLPAPSVFENLNFTHSWGGNGNYLLANNQVVQPLFGCRFEYEWTKDIAKRLGHYEGFVDGKPELEQWRRFLYEGLREKEPELPPYEEFLEAGGYTYKHTPTYIAYQKQREDFENNPFPTPSGKIEIYSKRIAEMNDPEARPAIPKYVPCAEGPEDPIIEKYPLQVVGWHTKRRAHSVHDNNSWLEEAEPQRVWINPADAAERGIADGDTVRVFNDRGVIRIPAYVTRRVIPGVTAIPQGAWHTPDKDGVDIRGNLNTITSTHAPTPYAKGNPQHTNLVEVAKA